MLNSLTRKEFDVQYALGLVSWYRVTATNYSKVWRDFKAVSENDALCQFKSYHGDKGSMRRGLEGVRDILWDVAKGNYQIIKLPGICCINDR